jgi:hypothetical protein
MPGKGMRHDARYCKTNACNAPLQRSKAFYSQNRIMNGASVGKWLLHMLKFAEEEH